MYIARQPIFNSKFKIFGYELLFRADEKSNSFSNASSASATAFVLGGLFEQGINRVVGNVKAFVNFDYEFIMSDMIELINPDTLVIEILESVKIDNLLLKRIEQLHNKGYIIALDDFIDDFFSCPAVAVADIIKFDIIETPLDTICMEVQEAISKNKILLAEKIESEEEYQKAKAMGFQLFQGYFFCKPSIVTKSSKSKKTSNTVYAQILMELKKDDFSYEKITSNIESDVNLSYRLLYALSHKKEENSYMSIKNALVRMGVKGIERWICVLMLQSMSVGKPDEVLRLSLVRFKFSEYIAEKSSFKQRKDEVSMMSLFSMLDVILNCSMAEAMEGLAISQDITDALVSGTGVFKPLQQLMSSYEKGNWDEVENYSTQVNISPETLTNGYLSAIEWASSTMNIQGKTA